MHRALRFLLLVGLGGLSAPVFLLGAEPFEVPGQNPLGERLGGSVALALYFAACQFWFARGDAKAGTSSATAIAAMLLGLGASVLLVVAAEGRAQWQYFALPALLAGVIGAAVGVAIGRRAGASGAA